MKERIVINYINEFGQEESGIDAGGLFIFMYLMDLLLGIDICQYTTKVTRGMLYERSKAKSELLKNLNPIIKEYMQEKKIRMVVDKKSLLLADENLDITKEILDRLNKKLKSINIK